MEKKTILKTRNIQDRQSIPVQGLQNTVSFESSLIKCLISHRNIHGVNNDNFGSCIV